MARSVILLVPLLLVGCVSSRSTALLDAPPLEAEVWLAIGQSNMEVFADKVPRGPEHVEVQQFGHDPQFNIPLWTSLKRAGKFSAVAGEFAATLSRLRRRPVRVIAAAVAALTYRVGSGEETVTRINWDGYAPQASQLLGSSGGKARPRRSSRIRPSSRPTRRV